MSTWDLKGWSTSLTFSGEGELTTPFSTLQNIAPCPFFTLSAHLEQGSASIRCVAISLLNRPIPVRPELRFDMH